MRKGDGYENFQERILDEINDKEINQSRAIIKKGKTEGLSFEDIDTLCTPGMDGKRPIDKVEGKKD